MHGWLATVCPVSIENTVQDVVTTLVIAPFPASRPQRSHSANFRSTSSGSPAREAPPPLHTFVRILHEKRHKMPALLLFLILER